MPKKDDLNDKDGKVFKAPVPESHAIPGKILAKHPFSEAECARCYLLCSCRNCSGKLPIIVRGVSKPFMIHNCKAKGLKVKVCEVRRAALPAQPNVTLSSIAVKEMMKEKLAPEHPPPKINSRRHPPELYLLDSNIFIIACNQVSEKHNMCRWVIEEAHILKGATCQVIEELTSVSDKTVLSNLNIFKVGSPDPQILGLKPGVGMKAPSPADLSLMQGVIEKTDARGIVTLDRDFVHVAAAGVLSKITGRAIAILTPDELQRKIGR